MAATVLPRLHFNLKTVEFSFRARIWLYEGESAWYFVTLPTGVSAEITAAAGPRKAWGSVRVVAGIGGTRWNTSLFLDRKTGAFLLPLKAAVRAKEQLRAGESVEVSILLV